MELLNVCIGGRLKIGFKLRTTYFETIINNKTWTLVCADAAGKQWIIYWTTGKLLYSSCFVELCF